MNRLADIEVWRTARTLSDLGNLTARWIEGGLYEQPGYYGPTDITDPEIADVLAELNRAGYLTTWSQAAGIWTGGYGGDWKQLAAVSGLADEATARRIVTAAAAAGLTTVVHAPPPWWSWRFRYDRAVTVTWHDGIPLSPAGAAGVRRPCGDLRNPQTGYGTCHRDAVRAVCNAWQVTVIDPCSVIDPWFGRPEYLWNTLTRALGGKRGAAA